MFGGGLGLGLLGRICGKGRPWGLLYYLVDICSRVLTCRLLSEGQFGRGLRRRGGWRRRGAGRLGSRGL